MTHSPHQPDQPEQWGQQAHGQREPSSGPRGKKSRAGLIVGIAIRTVRPS